MTKYDIAVFGASGFTGQLVARYLASRAVDESFKLVAVGRNREKVQQRMQQVGVTADVLVADSNDEASLRAVLTQVKVVASLIGPYMAHGELLYKLCAELGVHYCDLTGETPFVYKMVKKYTRSALASKAILINAAGFDSVPSDLNTFLAAQRLSQIDREANVGAVRSTFAAKGGLSGGTLASLIGLLEAGQEDRKIATDPYALCPIEGKHRPAPVLAKSVTFENKTTWGGFFIMAPYNTAIVRRSWGIFESAAPGSRPLNYGPSFTYDEYMKMSGPISSFFLSIALYLGFGAILLNPIRALVKKFGLQSGDGPSKEAQENGWFETTTVATSQDQQHQVQVVLKGKGDPGYGGTSIMISEIALALLKDHDRLSPLAQQGGALTPATALGNVLVERLEKTGKFSFTIQDSAKKSA
ncbi:saccharopine dehydrogenase family protein [Sporobolomyces koalae]|uniref:saccharopine dehydrogenase family protein n=1 Tax=Sporobolomyces koalae TaxID=500713 RepID=UPI0031741701